MSNLIRDEFNKIELYKLEIQRNETLIQTKTAELDTKKRCFSTDVFVYLKDMDEQDIIKKQISNLHTKNNNMKEELKVLPDTIRAMLGKSIKKHFATLEQHKQEEQHKQDKKIKFREKSYKMLKMGSGFSGLLIVLIFARKAFLSRK
tara:strand:- start:65 stop:505 length:441 start_codon:yes stop_codon:yes gene_type:complete